MKDRASVVGVFTSLTSSDDSATAIPLHDVSPPAPVDSTGFLEPGLARALQFIDVNFEDRLRLVQVAHVAGLSAWHFSRLFKHRLGISYVRYVASVRIQRARALLTTTARTVTDICYDVGFNDLSHFERVFHRLNGIPPSQYRRVSRLDAR